MQVEILASGHLGPHGGPNLPDPAAGRRWQFEVGDGVVGPGQREVPAEQGPCGAQSSACSRPRGCGILGSDVGMQGGLGAAQPGAIQQVVMHERAGLDEFDCGSDTQSAVDLAVVLASLAGTQRPPQELWPHALAAVEREPCHAFGHTTAEDTIQGKSRSRSVAQDVSEHGVDSSWHIPVNGCSSPPCHRTAAPGAADTGGARRGQQIGGARLPCLGAKEYSQHFPKGFPLPRWQGQHVHADAGGAAALSASRDS